MLREPCLSTSIDVLYLDNTNCDPNRDLPTRQRATQQIKEIIRSHPDYTVVIGESGTVTIRMPALYIQVRAGRYGLITLNLGLIIIYNIYPDMFSLGFSQ